MAANFPSQSGGTDPAADSRSPWPALAGLMIVAAVLRGIALNQQLWYDEMTTLVQSVRQPLGQILTTYTSQNQHMLYNVMARLAMDAFGDHIWTLRLPAVIFGVAAIPALYFCARQWTTAREAWLACGLLTASYHHVWFSQNARGYTGMAFWTLLTTYLFVRARREQCTKLWLCYGAAMALGLYTHLTMGFVTAGHLAVVVWLALRTRAEWGKPLLGFVSAGVLTLLLYAPILPQVMQRTVGQATKTSVESDWTNPLWLAVEAIKGLAEGAAPGVAGYVALAVAASLFLAGLASYWRQDGVAVALMVVPGVITAAVMLGLGHNLWPRFFFFAIGFAFLLLMRGAMRVGEALAGMAERPAQGVAMGTALAGLMILGSAWSVRSAWIYPKQDFVGAMEWVDAQRKADEPVLVTSLAVFPYTQYFRREWKAVDSREELDAARAAGKPVWLLSTFPVFLKSRHPDAWETIEREFTPMRVFRGTIGDGEVRVYRWTPAAPQPQN